MLVSSTLFDVVYCYCILGIARCTEKTIREKQIQGIRERLKNIAVLLLDEISTVGESMWILLDYVFRKCFDSTLPFGGVAILIMGDFWQLPPVGEQTLMRDANDVDTIAGKLLSLFQVIEFKKLERCKDSEFGKHLAHFRDIGNFERPITVALLKSLKALTIEDLEADKDWWTAPALVGGNSQKAVLNLQRALQYGRLFHVPVFAWYKNIAKDDAQYLNSDYLGRILLLRIDMRSCCITVVSCCYNFYVA